MAHTERKVYSVPRRYALATGASPWIFEWGTNRRQVANLSPKYPKNQKKTSDLGRFILESRGDDPS